MRSQIEHEWQLAMVQLLQWQRLIERLAAESGLDPDGAHYLDVLTEEEVQQYEDDTAWYLQLLRVLYRYPAL